MDWPRTLAAKADAALAAAHLRWRPPPSGGSVLHCILLDCSASMLQGQRLSLAKALLLRWTAELYRRREHLAVIGFSGQHARVLQAPRKAVAFNEAWIAAIPGGGATPACSAVELADRMLQQRRRKLPAQAVALWLLTDARFRELPPRPRHADLCTVVDFDDAAVALGRAARIAKAWDAELLRASELTDAP